MNFEQRISILEKKLLKEYSHNYFEIPIIKAGISKEFMRKYLSKSYKSMKPAGLKLSKFVGSRMFVHVAIIYVEIESVVYHFRISNYYYTGEEIRVSQVDIREHENGERSNYKEVGSFFVDTDTFYKEVRLKLDVIREA